MYFFLFIQTVFLKTVKTRGEAITPTVYDSPYAVIPSFEHDKRAYSRTSELMAIQEEENKRFYFVRCTCIHPIRPGNRYETQYRKRE